MEDDARGAIVSFCREAIGDELRSVLAFSISGAERSHEILYLREDVPGEYDDVETVAGRVLDEFALESVGYPWVEQVHPFGDLHGTVQVFDDATLVRFAVDERHGVSVSVDPGTGVDFERFVREWQDRFGGATVEF